MLGIYYWFLELYTGIISHSYFPSQGISLRMGSSWSGGPSGLSLVFLPNSKVRFPYQTKRQRQWYEKIISIMKIHKKTLTEQLSTEQQSACTSPPCHRPAGDDSHNPLSYNQQAEAGNSASSHHTAWFPTSYGCQQRHEMDRQRSPFSICQVPGFLHDFSQQLGQIICKKEHIHPLQSQSLKSDLPSRNKIKISWK